MNPISGQGALDSPNLLFQHKKGSPDLTPGSGLGKLLTNEK